MKASEKKVVNIETGKFVRYESAGLKSARIAIRVIGEGPLLTHNPAGMATQSDDAKRGKRIPSPEDEAEAGAYRLEDGTLGIKGEAFIACINAAAGAFKTKNRGTMKSRLAHIRAVEELVPFTYASDGAAINSYAIDRRPVVVQKARVMRSRPQIDGWAATFTVIFDPVLVEQPLIILEILADAGSRIGVGDYRPRFGRFRVDSYALL